MKALVTYGDDSEVEEIEVMHQGDTHAHVGMVGSTALVNTIHPLTNHEFVGGHHIKNLLAYLESLPFVETANLSMGCEQ